jgi:hypothetical protein
METILLKDDFYISKDYSKNIFLIELNIPNDILIKSLKQIIIGATVSSNFKTIRFKASSIKTYQQFKEEQHDKNKVKNLRIRTVAKMFINMVNQLKYLITHDKSFIGYSPENIIVIDDNKFIYLSNEHLTSIQNNMIELTFPFTERDFYLSPEQEKITELPSTIHYKTAYYSLANLIIDALFPFCQGEEEGEDKKDFINKLENSFIKDTSLYFTLKNCLVEEAEERRILFI